MSSQAANVIDFQAYRDARDRSVATSPSEDPVLPVQPFLMWVPYIGFIPVVPFGKQQNYGA
ncbi:hypothetical protein GR212_18910 [Rhizobium lusitanum]|uniref:Uncharacterized protein n=1 Tax=Rhizobium lusitanum TaxID=293958 RepID=A0A6L9UBZ1_9HYPH|nr:hypothetical protein [Rhizobium lusitanum]NEI71657.1 hypothetical protein [Rhizobium lusitanum]